MNVIALVGGSVGADGLMRLWAPRGASSVGVGCSTWSAGAAGREHEAGRRVLDVERGRGRGWPGVTDERAALTGGDWDLQLRAMLRTFRLGRLLGFPIEVNLTFLILLGVVALTMGGLSGVAIILLAFGSVLLHELGHALVARHLGVRVAGIELHFFGGAAKIIDQPKRAGDEIAIAAAGPAVSFALAGIAALGSQVPFAPFAPLLGTLAWINLIIGAFNLIPALPMDGGRILRAALSGRVGFVRATEISVKIARVFAVVLVLYGVVTFQFYPLLLAGVLWFMGSAELFNARISGRRYEGEVEVLPRGAHGPAAGDAARRGPLHPFFGRGFTVRHDGRRYTIEPLD